MRFGLYSLLALVPVALALPALEERAATGAAAVVSGIQKIQADAATLSKTLQTFQANDPFALFTALKIQSQAGAISNDLKAVTKTAQNSQPFSDEGSGDIANAVLSLSPNIESLLNLIVQKKPAFATGFLLVGDLSKTVLKLLQEQQSLTKTFAAAVTNKLSDSYKSLAPIVTDPINQYFADAIAAYKKCTGAICLPPIG